jgi:hypothetical protein
LAVRRDGQIISSGSIGGGNIGGGGVASILYYGGTNILISGTTISVCGTVNDSACLGGNLACTYAPLYNPAFTCCISVASNIGIGITSPTATKLDICYCSTCIDAIGLCNYASGGKRWFVGDGAGVAAGIFGFYDATDTVAVLTMSNTGIGSPSFSTGFFGDGWQITPSATLFNLEVDNLIVRKLLKAYTLEVDKIDAVGGTLIISPANGTVSSIWSTNLYFDTNHGANPIGFAVGDYIAAQLFDGAGVNSYRAHVTGVYQYGFGECITVDDITGTPWVGMKLVQIGSSTTATRQNLLYLSSSDVNNPRISGYAGVTDGVLAGHEHFRLGNLSGITDSFFGALSGWGIWSDNAIMDGYIKSTCGLLGGWIIKSDSIYNGVCHVTDGYSTSGITLAANGGLHGENFYINSNGQTRLTVKKCPSETLRNCSTGGVCNTSVVYCKKKTMTFNDPLWGTIRTRFELKSNSGTYSVCAKLRKNCVDIGTEQSTASSSYNVKCQDLTLSFVVGDTLELWLQGNIDSDAYACNFALYYDDNPETCACASYS